MHKFIVKRSFGKQIGLAFLSLIMVGMSLLVIYIGGVLVGIVGTIGLVFFGGAGLYIIVHIFIGYNLVVLTDEGIYDYSSAIATGKVLIPWDNIKKIEESAVLSQEFVSLSLIDPSPIMNKLPAYKQKAIRANVKLGAGEINISLQSARNCTNAQLMHRMNQFIQKDWGSGEYFQR